MTAVTKTDGKNYDHGGSENEYIILTNTILSKYASKKRTVGEYSQTNESSVVHVSYIRLVSLF